MKRALVVALILLAGLAGGFGVADASTITMHGRPVTVHYEESNARVAEKVLGVCNRDLDRIAAQIGLEDVTPIDIRVTDDIRPYRARMRGQLPDWGVAFALLREQTIIVDVPKATQAMNSLESVIPHELSHILVAQKTRFAPIPVWFAEGLAQWQAGEWTFVDAWQLMSAVWAQEVPHLRDLVNTYPRSEVRARTAYRVSYAAFEDLFSQGFAEVPYFLEDVRDIGFEGAIEKHTGYSSAIYAIGFHDRLRQKYHSRLFLFQTEPLWSVLAVLFVIAGAGFLLRKRRRLKRMDEPFDVV